MADNLQNFKDSMNASVNAVLSMSDASTNSYPGARLAFLVSSLLL